MKKHTIYIILLVVSSIYQLFGIFFLHWNSLGIVILYLLETFSVGIFFIIEELLRLMSNRSTKPLKNIFFVVSGFILIPFQLFFLLLPYYVLSQNPGLSSGVWMTLELIHEIRSWIFLVVLSQIPLLMTFLYQKEYRYINISYSKKMRSIFSTRTFLAQLTIIFSFWLFLFWQYPQFWAFILLLLQTIFNLFVFRKNLIWGNDMRRTLDN